VGDRTNEPSPEPHSGVPAAAPRITDPNCELCEAAEFTRWFHRDDTCWVAECDSCDDPMVVWRSHGTEPTEAEVEHMVGHLEAAAREVFADNAYLVDRNRRTIPDHWHAHARLKRF
jgi:hypothetical protein